MQTIITYIAIGMWSVVSAIGVPTLEHLCNIPQPISQCSCPIDDDNPCCQTRVTFTSVDLPAIAQSAASPSDEFSLHFLPIRLTIDISGQFCGLQIAGIGNNDPPSSSTFHQTIQTTHLLI